MKKFYDVKLKITAKHIGDNNEFWKLEESADCVVFDTGARKIWTYDRAYENTHVLRNTYVLPRGNIYTIVIEFKP